MSILLNSDTAWLLTVCEKLLDGAVYGRDIVETNPPMSALIYMPAVLFARTTGLNADLCTLIYTLLLAFTSSRYLYRFLIKRNLIAPESQKYFGIALLFLTMIFPFGFITEKDHLALYFILPYLAISVGRYSNSTISWKSCIISGLGLGITISIKPHYALVPLFILVEECFEKKRLLLFFRTEYWIALSIIIGYILSLFAFFDYYIYKALPQLIPFYALSSRSFYMVFLNSIGILYIIGFIFTLIFMVKLPLTTVQKVFGIASLAFYTSFILQSKGYPYQLYPALVCFYLTFFSTFSFKSKYRLISPLSALLIQIIIIGFLSSESLYILYDNLYYKEKSKVAFVSSLQKNPSMACLCSNNSLAFPTVRGAQGSWSSAYSNAWAAPLLTTKDVKNLGREHYESRNIQIVLEQLRAIGKDIIQNQPDLVLMDSHPFWKKMIFNNPMLASSLDNYEYIADFYNVSYYKRKQTLK